VTLTSIHNKGIGGGKGFDDGHEEERIRSKEKNKITGLVGREEIEEIEEGSTEIGR